MLNFYIPVFIYFGMESFNKRKMLYMTNSRFEIRKISAHVDLYFRQVIKFNYSNSMKTSTKFSDAKNHNLPSYCYQISKGC